jgi:hypothetical protein
MRESSSQSDTRPLTPAEAHTPPSAAEPAPTWVKVSVALMIVLVLVLIVVHLMGNGLGSHLHMLRQGPGMLPL